MKKALSFLLVAAMLTASLAACGTTGTSNSGTTSSSKDSDASLPRVMNITTNTDPQSFEYLVSSYTTDADTFANFVDGLTETDSFGNITMALAKDYKVSDDELTYTFTLKEGVKWMTSTGEEYAEVTAKDFETALQHAADFKSPIGEILFGVIKNYQEYSEGKVDFSEVGVKAVDDHTVQYTLERPTPYFLSLTLYSIFYPLNKEFLESKGEGCILGKPDKDKCSFGSLQGDSILYNGAYILSTFDAKSKVSFKVNPTYWDKENVFIDEINVIYNDGKDPYANIKGFERGIYASAILNNRWKDFEEYKAKYRNNYIASLENSTVFYMNLNYNRKSFNYTSKTPEQQEATKKAVLNKNFRMAYRAAFDRLSYLKQRMPEEIALNSMRNMSTFPPLVRTSDGTAYGTLVSQAYREATNEKDVSLADGQDPFYNPEKAREYIKAAEADGIQFPITLDLPYLTNLAEVFVNQAQSFKTSVETNTDGKILINLVGLTDEEYEQITYRNQDPEKADYDINTTLGWGPDYADPNTFSELFSVHDGHFLHALGLKPMGEDPENDEILKTLGLDKYTELYDAAQAEISNLDERYKLFAKADAQLVADAVIFPSSMRPRAYVVTRIQPFTKMYSPSGVIDSKYKKLKLQEQPITAEQYREAYTIWENGGNH